MKSKYSKVIWILIYIKNYNLNKNIYIITEEGKIIEKKLMNREKKNYFSGFKSKYNGLMRKNKKNIIDINEYINLFIL